MKNKESTLNPRAFSLRAQHGFTLPPRAFSLRAKHGFTLIELLVVVAIIGVLATIVLSSLNDARARARDAKRQSDMKSIYNALVLYELDRGFAATTTSYSESESSAGGFDTSTAGGFMTFLSDAGYIGTVPVDPININSGNDASFGAGDYFYRYYCYSPGTNKGVQLTYKRESDDVTVYYSRDYSLGTVSNNSDGYFDCSGHS